MAETRSCAFGICRRLETALAPAFADRLSHPHGKRPRERAGVLMDRGDHGAVEGRGEVLEVKGLDFSVQKIRAAFLLRIKKRTRNRRFSLSLVRLLLLKNNTPSERRQGTIAQEACNVKRRVQIFLLSPRIVMPPGKMHQTGALRRRSPYAHQPMLAAMRTALKKSMNILPTMGIAK